MEPYWIRRRSGKMKQRSEQEIITDMLYSIANDDSITSTGITFQANVSYRAFQKLRDMLIKKGLIIRNGKRFELTDKGEVFLTHQLNAVHIFNSPF